MMKLNEVFPKFALAAEARRQRIEMLPESGSLRGLKIGSTILVAGAVQHWASLMLCPIVDYRHLPLPSVPCVIVSNQISHEVTYVDSTGLSRIKDRASSR